MKEGKELVRQVTEGFEYKGVPNIITNEGIKVYNKTNGNGSIEFYPNVARAFPVLGFAGDYQLSYFDYFADITEGKINIENPNAICHNSQEKWAGKIISGIDYAGRLVNSLDDWITKGERETIKGTKCDWIPVDTNNNEFRKFYYMRANPNNEWFEFNVDRLEKSIDNSRIPQVKNISKDLVSGGFNDYLNNIISEADILRKIDKESVGGLGDYLKNSPEKFIEFFGAMRNIYEIGSKGLDKMAISDLRKYPTWETTNVSDLKVGDYIQGCFRPGSNKMRRSAMNHDGVVSSIQNGLISLENVGKGFGVGDEKLENIKIETGNDEYSRFIKIWKFVEGTN